MRKTLLLTLMLAAPLVAQAPADVTLGDRVRVVAPKSGYGTITGHVVAKTPDALSVAVGRAGTEVAVARDQIDMLFLSVATRRHVVGGTLLGAVGGAFVAWKFSPRENGTPGSIVESGRGSTKNYVTATLVGASLGALVGYVTETDRWIRVHPPASP